MNSRGKWKRFLALFLTGAMLLSNQPVLAGVSSADLDRRAGIGTNAGISETMMQEEVLNEDTEIGYDGADSEVSVMSEGEPDGGVGEENPTTTTGTILIINNPYIGTLEYTYEGEDPLAGRTVELVEADETGLTGLKSSINATLREQCKEVKTIVSYKVTIANDDESTEISEGISFTASTNSTVPDVRYWNGTTLSDSFPEKISNVQVGANLTFVTEQEIPAFTAASVTTSDEKVKIDAAADKTQLIPEETKMNVQSLNLSDEGEFKTALDSKISAMGGQFKNPTTTAYSVSFSDFEDSNENVRMSYELVPPQTGEAVFFFNGTDLTKVESNAEGKYVVEEENVGLSDEHPFAVVYVTEYSNTISCTTTDGATVIVNSGEDYLIPPGAMLVVTEGEAKYRYTDDSGSDFYQIYDFKFMVDSQEMELSKENGTFTVVIENSAKPIFEGRGQIDAQNVENAGDASANVTVDNNNNVFTEKGAITKITYTTNSIDNIKVTANRTSTTYDMSADEPEADWVKNVVIYYKEGEDWIPYKEGCGHIFAENEDIKMSVEVSVPHTPNSDKDVYLYAGDIMKLQLPPALDKTFGQANVSIEPDMGTFSIDDDGMVTVTLNDSYLDDPDGKLGTGYYLEFEGALDFNLGEGEQETETITIGDVILEFEVGSVPIEEKAAIEIKKEASETEYENNNKNHIAEYQEYTITITAPKSNTIPIKTVSLKDYFDVNYQNYFTYIPYDNNNYVQIVSPENGGNNISVESSLPENEKALQATVQIGNLENEEDGLKAGEQIVLKYKVKVDPSIYFPGENSTSVEHRVKNTVEAITDKNITKKDDEEVIYKKSLLDKKYDEIDEDGYAHYTVHINFNPLMDLSAYTLVDKLLGDNQEFQIDAKHLLTLGYYNTSTDTNVYKTESYSKVDKSGESNSDASSQDIYFDKDGRLCINLSKQIETNGKKRGEYHIKLGYWTKVTVTDDQFGATLKNQVTLQGDDGKGEIIGGTNEDVTFNYALYSIGKKVESAELLERRIKWSSVLTAYPYKNDEENQYTTNYIPQGAVYEDYVTIGGNASSHKFGEPNSIDLKLTYKGNDGKDTEVDSSAYTFSRLTDGKDGFKITFKQDVLSPVTITYYSEADFAKGKNGTSDALEKYINHAILHVNDWNTGWVDAEVDYQLSALIDKNSNGYTYDRDKRTLTWNVVVNSGEYDLNKNEVAVKETIPSGTTLTKIVNETTKTEISLDDCTENPDGIWTIPLGIVDKKSVTLVITTRLDDSFKEELENKHFLNKATIVLNETDYASASAEQIVDFKKVDKNHEIYEGGNTLKYFVYLNEAGQNLNPAVGGNTFYLKDEMKDFMELVPGSLHVYDLSKEGTEQELPVDIEMDDEKGNLFKIELPDETPLKIVYTVSFPNKPIGTPVELDNKATLYYGDTLIGEDNDEYNITIKKASGYGTGPVKVRIRKVDRAQATALLKGSEFRLYKYKTGATGEETWEQLKNLTNYNLVGDYKDNELETAWDGIVEFPNIIQNVYYAVKEVTAPENYSYDKNMITVFIVDNEGLEYNESVKVLTPQMTEFVVKNDKAELAIDKVFTKEDGTVMADGELPDGTYYFAVYDKDDKLAKNLGNEDAVGFVKVENGAVVKAAGSEYALTFKLPYGNYTVYESDKDGNKLTGEDGYLISNGNRFEVTNSSDGTICSIVTNVNQNSVPAVAKLTNKVLSTPLTIKAEKSLVNKKLENGEFTFQLKDVKTDQVWTGTNDANGNISFQLHYLYDAVGDYEYELTEFNTEKPGITYDDKKKFTLHVKVGRNKTDGTVEIQKVTCDGRELLSSGKNVYNISDKDNLETVFKNVYTANGSVKLNATKKILGTVLHEQNFDFEISKYKKTGNEWEAAKFKNEQFTEEDVYKKVSNLSTGELNIPKDYFLFNEEVDDRGTYRYVISEKDSALKEYETDSDRYAIEIAVKDDGAGKLAAKVEKIIKIDKDNQETEADKAEFVNTYKATGSFVPTVKKILAGKDLGKETFSFKLEQAAGGKQTDWTAEGFDIAEVTFAEIKDTYNDVKNGADGIVNFPEITYNLKGSASDVGYYVYRITENIPKDAQKVENSDNLYTLNGYTYTTEPVYIYVNVTDDGNGVLKVDTYQDTERNLYNGTITNKYQAAGTIVLNGTKTLNGRELKAGAYSFSLWEAGKAASQPEAEAYKYVASVTNEADGSFAFPVINYNSQPGDINDVVGTYWYRIQEEIPEEIPAGYTYGSDGVKEYIIKVVVSHDDSKPGKLQAAAYFADGTPFGTGGAEFVNSYHSEGQWDIKATKILKGSQLLDDQYTFTLEKGTEVVQTVTNKADGTIAFAPVIYTQADMNNLDRQELVYYIREKVPSQIPDGVTYDKTLYKIYVTLTDDGKGNIKVDKKIVTVEESDKETEKETEVTEITFTNEFEGSVILKKTAEDDATPLAGAEFTLYFKAEGASSYVRYGSYTTGASGLISISGLPAGDYYFVETRAPEGYLIETDSAGSPRKYEFVIGTKGADAVVNKALSVRNHKGLGRAELSKTDEDTKKPLAGAEFTLYTAAGKEVAVVGDNGVYSAYSTDAAGSANAMITNAEGKIQVSNLAWGSYYFKETKAPEGYILSDKKYSFVIDENSFNTDSDGKPSAKIVTVSATNKATDIDIIKVDQDGKALSGAKLAVKDAETGDILEQWVSDGKPHNIYGKLTAGKTYYLAELSAPEGYFIAKDVEFTVPALGTVTITMEDEKEEDKSGSIYVDKRVSYVDEDFNEMDLIVEDATYYVGLFTDPEGKHPFGENYIQEVHLHHSSTSDTAVYTELPSGTYYILEVDENGNPLPMDELIEGENSFVCTVDGDGNFVTIDLDTEEDMPEGTVHLNNRYYDLPDGYYFRAYIDITKKVLRGTEEITADDTFYAGVFTRDVNGDYELYLETELEQNGTVTVEVALGGEDGMSPVTYYVFETDGNGNPVDLNGFAYEVTGEGAVTVESVDSTQTITITNKESDGKTGILKVDENGMPLEGAKFRLASEDGSHEEVWTSNGSANYTDLAPGKYILTEILAPGGYVKGDDITITVAADGSVSLDGNSAKLSGNIIKYVNKKAASGTSGTSTGGKGSAKTVKTGDETDILRYLNLLAAAILGAGALLYFKKRQRNKIK